MLVSCGSDCVRNSCNTVLVTPLPYKARSQTPELGDFAKDPGDFEAPMPSPKAPEDAVAAWEVEHVPMEPSDASAESDESAESGAMAEAEGGRGGGFFLGGFGLGSWAFLVRADGSPETWLSSHIACLFDLVLPPH